MYRDAHRDKYLYIGLIDIDVCRCMCVYVDVCMDR